MKCRKYLIFTLALIAVILEMLPFGAVLSFATPEKTVVNTYSYFDLTVFGYANFGPFLTSVLSCVLAVLCCIGLFVSSKGIRVAITVISFAATAFSLMPLMFGIGYYTFVAFCITAVHLIIAIISLLKE